MMKGNYITCIYVHGFGGTTYNDERAEKFEKQFRGDDFPCDVETYSWRPPLVSGKHTAKEWLEGKKLADKEGDNLCENLLSRYEKEGRLYYLIGFSLGCRVIIAALGKASKLTHCLGIYLLGAAIPRDTQINAGKFGDNIQIRNYYSPTWDWVLAKVYTNVEGEPAGGQKGLMGQRNIINMQTGCSHKALKNYSNLISGIAQLISYENGYINTSYGLCYNINSSVRDDKTFWGVIIETVAYSYQKNLVFGQYRVLDKRTSKRIAWARHLHPILTHTSYPVTNGTNNA